VARGLAKVGHEKIIRLTKRGVMSPTLRRRQKKVARNTEDDGQKKGKAISWPSGSNDLRKKKSPILLSRRKGIPIRVAEKKASFDKGEKICSDLIKRGHPQHQSKRKKIRLLEISKNEMQTTKPGRTKAHRPSR